MSRTLKRVAMDFSWPLHVVWKGYYNPYQGTKCKPCDGSGYGPEAKQVSDDWYSGRRWRDKLVQYEVDVLVAEGRLREFTHKWDGKAWIATGYKPTAEEVNAWSRNGPGHDSINRHICVAARCKRLGYTLFCSLCNGSGKLWCDPKYKKRHDEWKEIEPPVGEGFQLWENTSEGSPISPVFATLDELCAWCEKNATTFADQCATTAQWKEMLEKDFSAIVLVFAKAETKKEKRL